MEDQTQFTNPEIAVMVFMAISVVCTVILVAVMRYNAPNPKEVTNEI